LPPFPEPNEHIPGQLGSHVGVTDDARHETSQRIEVPVEELRHNHFIAGAEPNQSGVIGMVRLPREVRRPVGVDNRSLPRGIIAARPTE
jgi:hypothetical protein